jgi:predicted ArsR family transcriptional regulator
MDNQQRIIDALQSVGPMTAAELRGYLGVCRDTINKFVRRLRAERKVRIASYQRGRRQPAPVYGLGSGKDAAWEPLSDAERSARYRARIPFIIRARRRVQPPGHWDQLKA